MGPKRKGHAADVKVCYCLALGPDDHEVWKQAFTARLERWLKKEGFKGPSSELLADFFERLSKRGMRHVPSARP
jgi:hypothetical protein